MQTVQQAYGEGNAMKSVVFLSCIMALAAFGACANEPNAAALQVFERVFGDAVRLDAVMVRSVISSEPGQRHYVDPDGDGQPEEVWFVDNGSRHPEEWRPVLVRAIDEDGDLLPGQEPDLDSDLYVADWKGDGVVDAVLDYTDIDGDNDVDEMAFYFPGKPAGATEDGLMAWWGRDIGDDNLLWYDVGYTYRQPLCQYRTHFGGDELFCAFAISMKDPEWICLWENPFLFYDHDGDAVTEEVVRIEGRNEGLGKLRYSFDADNDATFENPRDFDVSISAHAAPGQTIDPRLMERITLRDIPTGPFLRYHVAPQFARETPWAVLMLTWVENDLNMDGDNLDNGRFTDTQERWEGVIAKGNDAFKQIGGPSGGLYNRRYELAETPRGPMRLYYAPTDQRLHLFGANRMWLAPDLDYDQQADMRYDYQDADNDGYIDTWILDADADGNPDDTWTAGGAPRFDVRYTFGEVTAIMQPLVAAAPDALFALDQRLAQAIAVAGGTDDDPVQRLLATAFDVPNLDRDLRRRLSQSNEALRYYLDLLKDRRIVALKRVHDAPDFWKAFGALRGHGDLAGMQALLEKEFGLAQNPLQALADAHADWNTLLDEPRAAWAQDWVPPNIGWESELCAYRAYWGQFDFFGKHGSGLILNNFAPGASYHEEQPWGMDALHVGASPGIGGATLYVNGIAFPVYSPNGEGAIRWSKRLIEAANDRVTIELLAENVGPEAAPYTVQFTCSAFAGRRDSAVDILVSGGAPGDAVELGLGLTRLPQQAFAFDSGAGIMANWGVQQAVIGEIGMGLLFPPERYLRCADDEDEHQVVLRIERGEALRYYIQGDWLRGRRFNRCPTIENWMRDLRRLRIQVMAGR